MGNKTKNFNITAWYLNSERIYQLIGTQSLLNKVKLLEKHSGPAFMLSEEGLARAFIQEELENWLLTNEVPLLAQLINNGELDSGNRFLLIHDFYCKGLSISNKTSKPLIQTKLRFKPNIQIEIPYSSKNLCCATARERLSGHSRLFVFAYIEKVKDNKITARPYFIGDIHYDFKNRKNGELFLNHGEVHVLSIDAFAKSKEEFEKEPPDLKVLKTIPEKEVKLLFAQLIHEGNIPNDWGGEKSDLFTANLQVSSQFVSAAFLFKGPSKFKQMGISDLGKNGDQMDRLFTEPAQLFVLQHCHSVSSAVRNMMRTYANQLNNPRLYCVIDGYDTIRILKAYKLIK